MSYSSRALTTKNKNQLFDIVTYFLFFSTHWFQDFLAEVTSVGLQTQYEAVCENLGLIAYLVQVVVIIIIHITVIIIITRPNAALLRAAGLDKIAKPGYSFDGYI